MTVALPSDGLLLDMMDGWEKSLNERGHSFWETIKLAAHVHLLMQTFHLRIEKKKEKHSASLFSSRDKYTSYFFLL